MHTRSHQAWLTCAALAVATWAAPNLAPRAWAQAPVQALPTAPAGATAASTPAPAPAGTTLSVQSFAVQGNTLLGEQVIAQALPATPAAMTLEDLQRAAQALQVAYRQAGYGAVVVILPQQTVAHGQVQLQVIEGKLSAVQATGYTGFSRENILRALPSLRLGQTPHLTTLDSELLMVNENPAKSVRVVLQPGESHGQVEALAAVQEQATARIYMGLDNTGNANTGRWRLFANYQHANVADRDIVLGLRLVTSPTHADQVVVLGSTLRVPLYGARMFIEGSLMASNVRSDTNLTPAGELRFAGKGLSVGARAIWLLPSLREAKSQAALGLDMRSYRNDCTLGVWGSAGCGSAAASVDVLPLTASYSLQKAGHYAMSLSYVANLPLGKAGNNAQFDASRHGARSNYQLLRWSSSVQHQLANAWWLLGRLEAQWAPRPLLSAEQLGAGGAGNVRGYAERESVGDTGAIASLEVRTPLGTFTGAAPSNKSTMLSAYVDAAALRNHQDATCYRLRSHCHLWSAGLGMVLHPRDDTAVRLDLGRAGKAANNTARGDWRLHLSLTHAL